MTKEQRKAWRKANPEKHREEQRKHYQRRKASVRLRQAKYRKTKAAKIKSKESSKRYRKTHKKQLYILHHVYRTRKTKAGGFYTLSEWKYLCKKYDYRCLRCHKRRKLTADHVIPVSMGGSSNISNIQPLCQPCNSKKGTKTTDYRV